MDAKRLLISGAVLLLLTSIPVAAQSQTRWIVDQAGGGNFTKIQDCIDTAADGDICRVNMGLYVENIDVSGKNITVVSAFGPYFTIVDGNHAGNVVTFEEDSTEYAVLDGFTIQSGSSPWGGGIYIAYGTSPTITNCIIAGNDGDGIFCYDGCIPRINRSRITGNSGTGIASDSYSSPIIENCEITLNGGGIRVTDDSSWGTKINNCIISGNDGDGVSLEFGGIQILRNSIIFDNGGVGVYTLFGPPEAVDNCLVFGNHGGGIFYDVSGLPITNSTITGNENGGVIAAWADPAHIVNSIIWDNTPQEIVLSPHSDEPYVTYSDVKGGWPGDGNINADPLFVAGGQAQGNYYLTLLSR